MGSGTPSVMSSIPWLEPTVHSLDMAVLYTLAYADLFDYPLTSDEIARYLVGVRASHSEVRRTLRSMDGVEREGRTYFLPGRRSITQMRRTRAGVAAEMWSRALVYGRQIARLPFVRMVALTGALAMENVRSADDDFDFLIVTEPGRLWLTRALVVALVVRPAMLRGDEVCPNFFVTSDSLVFPERDLYTAHELAQMIPLAGMDLYRKLRRVNAWSDAFLPNAQGPPARAVQPWKGNARLSSRILEPVLRTPLGERLERWEMERKILQLSRGTPGAEVSLNETCCKGHVNAHHGQVYLKFERRLSALSGPPQGVGGGN